MESLQDDWSKGWKGCVLPQEMLLEAHSQLHLVRQGRLGGMKADTDTPVQVGEPQGCRWEQHLHWRLPGLG